MYRKKQRKMLQLIILNGFSAQNTIPIACGIKYNNNGFNYVGTYKDSMDMYWNGFKRTLTLGGNNINLRIENPMNTDDKNAFYYKLVLMKIDINEYLLGDVNNDGVINSSDYVLIKNYVEGKTTFNDKQKKAADVNKDGVINSDDVALVQKFIMGQITSF